MPSIRHTDARGCAKTMRAAVMDVVQRQEVIGVDIVGDDEQATPVGAQGAEEHLYGFELEPPRERLETWIRERWDFPEFYARAHDCLHGEIVPKRCGG
jgi:methionine synthase II (cobalamin-independent)